MTDYEGYSEVQLRYMAMTGQPALPLNPELDYYNEVHHVPSGAVETIKRHYNAIRKGTGILHLEIYQGALRIGRRETKELLAHLPADLLLHLVKQDPELGLAIAFFKPI